MKKLAVFLGTALLVTMSWAPAHAASAGSPTTKRPALHIDQKTSKIYQYDGSPNGNGPTVPATLVSGRVKHCPPGNYRLYGSLVQRGVSLPVANDALGQGEYSCSGKTIRVEMPFGGEGLRPGHAKAYLSLRPFGCESKACSIESKRLVRVPGKITSIKLADKTSKIYFYDQGSTGGPGNLTVATYARVKNCPDGDYRFGGTLMQDGKYLASAEDALGQGEMTCRGGTSTVPLSATFTSPRLHPGWAKATFYFAPYGCEVRACTYQDKRVVRIPGKLPSPTS